MLFYLDEPRTLAAIAVALLVGTVAHGVVQTLVAGALGDRLPRATGRATLDPRKHFEPFGVVVMIIAVIGWGRPVPLTEPRFPGARPRYLLAVVSGALTHVVIAVLALGGYALTTAGAVGTLGGRGAFAEQLLATVAIVNVLLAVLSLVPLPPLDGARILWALAPRTPGWQKARYHLEEQNIGLAIAFVLLLPILGNSEGLLRRIVDAVGAPLLRVLASVFGLDSAF